MSPANKYTLMDGTPVPGTTTICNQLGKGEGLSDWIWNCGKQGKDWREQRDTAGDTGTLVHKTILRFLSGEEVHEVESDIVADCFEKFLGWWSKETQHDDYLITEQRFVSEKLGFGGQPDILVVNRRKLIDIKTSGGIYDSYWYQLAAYGILLNENGYKVDEYQILWLPKDSRFDCPIRTDLRKEKKIFKHLLEIYKLRNIKN